MEDAILSPSRPSSRHPSPEAELSPSPVVVKQESISRENSPFFSLASEPLASRHLTPVSTKDSDRRSPVQDERPVTPLPTTTELEVPCSQETVSTTPLDDPDDPDTPVKAKVEDEETSPFAVSALADSPPANQLSRRKRERGRQQRRKSGKPGLEQATSPVSNTSSSGQTKNLKGRGLKLTRANKEWYDMLASKQYENESMESTSAGNEPPPEPPAIPAHTFTNPRYERTLEYVGEILSRSFSWSLVPLRWAAHCAAMYILPLAIAIGLFSIVLYLLLPSSIFSIIPSVFSTTTTILAFPARLVVSKGPQLLCGFVGVGCGRGDTEQEENFRNATFATDLEVRNAHTVITNLNQLNDSSLRLSLDSVNIHAVGDAALHLSNWTERAYIAQQFYSLGSQSFTLGRSVAKLEVKGKAVMAHILHLYSQLWLKLEGSWEGKYSFEDVTVARDSLLEEVERALTELQEHVHITVDIADKALELAQRVGGEVVKQRGAIASQSVALELNQAWWRVNLPAAFQWDKLSGIQARSLAEDLKLTAASLSVVDTVKRCLVEMGLRLEAFHESVVYARTENRKRTYMGLSVEDLLKSLEDNLAKSRRAVDKWSEKD